MAMHSSSWSDRFAFDIALRLEGSGEPIDDILKKHGMTPASLLALNSDPVFLRKVSGYRDDVREKGMTFRLKARAQAEELLTTSWLLIHHPDVSPAVKADLIKSTVKWSGLEPAQSMEAPGGGVKITINLGGDRLGDATVIDSLPQPDQIDPT